jgi:hypothetical protein
LLVSEGKVEGCETCSAAQPDCLLPQEAEPASNSEEVAEEAEAEKATGPFLRASASLYFYPPLKQQEQQMELTSRRNGDAEGTGAQGSDASAPDGRDGNGSTATGSAADNDTGTQRRILVPSSGLSRPAIPGLATTRLARAGGVGAGTPPKASQRVKETHNVRARPAVRRSSPSPAVKTTFRAVAPAQYEKVQASAFVWPTLRPIAAACRGEATHFLHPPHLRPSQAPFTTGIWKGFRSEPRCLFPSLRAYDAAGIMRTRRVVRSRAASFS